jgi:hypothetical protein
MMLFIDNNVFPFSWKEKKMNSWRIVLTAYSAFAFLIILFSVKMESIAKAYKVKFVVDVAQLGEEDPLWQNGSLYFQALKIPWYSTTSSHGQIIGNFLKRVMMPYDQSLEIIGMDTGSLQEPIHDGKIRASSREQIKWLEQSIAATSSNWWVFTTGYTILCVIVEAVSNGSAA